MTFRDVSIGMRGDEISTVDAVYQCVSDIITPMEEAALQKIISPRLYIYALHIHTYLCLDICKLLF